MINSVNLNTILLIEDYDNVHGIQKCNPFSSLSVELILEDNLQETTLGGEGILLKFRENSPAVR